MEASDKASEARKPMRPYRCFLVRCRLEDSDGGPDQVGQSGRPAWRFTVQQAAPDAARRSFACLQDVAAFLEAELGTCGARVADTPQIAITQAPRGRGGVNRNSTRLEFQVNGATVMVLDGNGNLKIEGALTEASDVNRKENFGAVAPADVLSHIAKLPVYTWNYIGDDPATQHMGPIAQDFYVAFGLGGDDQHIAPLDANLYSRSKTGPQPGGSRVPGRLGGRRRYRGAGRRCVRDLWSAVG